jgi:hypothetical protein
MDGFALSERERALLPSDDDVEFYRKHGWYLTKKLLSDDEVDAMVAASERFYGGQRDRSLPRRPPHLAYWEPAHGEVQRHNDYIFYESDEIRRVLSKPIIAAVAARIAGTDQIRLWNSTLIYKPPNPSETSNIVPWHFDKHYWATCSSHNMLTAFIPFRDCVEEMGTVTMVDGSHAWREFGTNDATTRHFAHRDRSELEQMLEDNARHNGSSVVKIPINIPKGHMNFHHCRIYHGSGHNRSAYPRQAISFHLQDRDNRWQPFRLADGELVVYNNDALVRKTPDGVPDYSDPEFCPVLWEGRL